MFKGCSSITSLDLSSSNTAKVTDMRSMFCNCSGLTKIYVSDDSKTENVSNGTEIFKHCNKLQGAEKYTSSATGISMANYQTGYFKKSALIPYAKWDDTNKLLTFKVANAKEEGAYDLNTGENDPEWLSINRSCTKVIFTSSFRQASPTSCYRWFSIFDALKTIEGIENLNTEKVKNMSYMFYFCSKLESLDLSKFNTANVTNMSYMFFDCLALSTLDLLSFNTAKVENMSKMFAYCDKLTSLDLSSFNTEKVTNMSSMFSGWTYLKTIYVSEDFKTDNVVDGSEMFSGCYHLQGAESYNSSQITHTMANYKTGYFKTYYQQGDTKTELFGKTLSVESLDLSGDKDFVAHAPFTANTVSYARNLSTSTSTWFSLCLPFAYTPDNFTAYKLKGATANVVEIEEITGEIAAGTPVLFKFKDGENK